MNESKVQRSPECSLIRQADRTRMILVFFLLGVTLTGTAVVVPRLDLACIAIAMAALASAWSYFFLRWDSLLTTGRLPLAVTFVTLFDLAWISVFVLATGGGTSPYWALLLLPVIFSATFFSDAAFVLPLTAVIACILQALLGLLRPDVTLATAWDVTGRLFLTLATAWFAWGLANVLERERQASQRIVSHLTEGVLLVNSDGTVLLANPEMVRLSGLELHDLIGVSIFDLDQRAGYALFRQMVSGVLDRPTELRQTDLTLSGRQSTDLRCYTIPCGESHPLGWVIVVQDVTDVKALTRMKEEGLRILSHELRSPLASMQTMSSILVRLADGIQESDRDRAIRVIAEESDRLSELVSELLDITQVEQPVHHLERHPLSLSEVAEAVCDLHLMRARELGIELINEVPPKLPAVLGDFRRTVQLVSNLLENALRCTEPGGEVRLSAVLGNYRGLLRVSDTGCGIPLESLENIFEKFGRAPGQAHEHDGGLGLGLYVARLLARKQGGDLLVQSLVGVGTTFTLVLPSPEAMAAEAEAEPAPAPALVTLPSGPREP